MNTIKRYHLKPFLSILWLISSLLIIVFFQMEERRMGYMILKLNQEHKKISDQRRTLEIQWARLNRPQRLDQMAQSQLTLKKIQSNQVIHLSGTLESQDSREKM